MTGFALFRELNYFIFFLSFYQPHFTIPLILAFVCIFKQRESRMKVDSLKEHCRNFLNRHSLSCQGSEAKIVQETRRRGVILTRGLAFVVCEALCFSPAVPRRTATHAELRGSVCVYTHTGMCGGSTWEQHLQQTRSQDSSDPTAGLGHAPVCKPESAASAGGAFYATLPKPDTPLKAQIKDHLSPLTRSSLASSDSYDLLFLSTPNVRRADRPRVTAHLPPSMLKTCALCLTPTSGLEASRAPVCSAVSGFVLRRCPLAIC